MIEVYFGLKAMPFGQDIAPEDLYPSKCFQELMARLDFAHSIRGFALVTGEIGAGKSTALRAFASQLDETRTPAIYLADSALSPRSFYSQVLQRFGVRPAFQKSAIRLQFETLMMDFSRHQEKSPVLFIDEGHDLQDAMLQELRYVLNLSFDSGRAFTLILAGEPQLRSALKLKAFTAVAQRINIRYHLQPLPPEEVDAYLRHRLRVSGCDKPIFTEGAVSLLAAHSRGLLRPLGHLATSALLDTALHKKDFVEQDSVRRAIAEAEG